jgi:VanZ family protein
MNWAFLRWLADSPYATVAKIAAAAGLGALIDYLTTSDINPLVVAVAAAVLPVIINALNPADPRYGRGRAPGIYDVATIQEIQQEGE